MFFYSIKAKTIKNKIYNECNMPSEREEVNNSFAQKSDEFFEKSKEECFPFVFRYSGEKMEIGFISLHNIDVQSEALKFMEHIGFPCDSVEYDEITLDSMDNLLRRAERSGFVYDSTRIADCFKFLSIVRADVPLRFDESLVNNTADKNKLYKKASELMADNTLCPELDRIYMGRANAKAYGHPAHYLVLADNHDTRRELYKTLVQALYCNGRIESRRYYWVDCTPNSFPRPLAYETLYENSIGGTVVIRFNTSKKMEDEDDDITATASAKTEDYISMLCGVMNKYRNKVQTILCLPKNNERIRMLFNEYADSVVLIEIKEDLIEYDRACKFLKSLCKSNNIRADKSLLDLIKKGETYYPDELRKTFETWFNSKIRTAIYPQYKDFQVSGKKALKDNKVIGNAYEELNSMIGLSSSKKIINTALNYYKIQRIYASKGLKQDRPAMHMIFTGNPGTAKTTVARLFAQIMKDNGLLSSGHLVEVGRGDLVGKYVGWTAKTVQAKFREAMGGVLFIDEAYSLVDDRGGSFGDEAINTIVQEMENHKEDLVVIFAGYPKEMQRFLDKNPGLSSRIAFHVDFDDYTTSELCEIARHIGKNKGLSISDAAMEKLSGLFESAKAKSDFGNGRYVRNIIECAKMNIANRIVEMDPDSITPEMLTTIEADDISIPEISAPETQRVIGFVA